MDKIIFISKDALRKGALSFYGNQYWKTKNIDELAQKGTVYEKYYTAGGSTAMAFTAMATGQYLFASGRKLYDGNEGAIEGNNLFDRLYDAGYDVHIAWDKSYTTFADKHFKCEGKHTTIHSLDRIIPAPSPHISGQFDDLTFLDDETEKGMELVRDLFSGIKAIKGKAFLWFHLPHVFRGRNAYDSDMDVFDNIIGSYFERLLLSIASYNPTAIAAFLAALFLNSLLFGIPVTYFAAFLPFLSKTDCVASL